MKYYLAMLCVVAVTHTQVSAAQVASMSKRTVLNEKYSGLLENKSIPVDIHERDGKLFASFGSTLPIHRCTEQQVAEYAETTHHYSGIFTQEPLAPLSELAYVRIDDTTVEKVFINRNKRILVRSSDGRLAQWRCAPTFESGNEYIAGAPVVSAAGALLSLVTARRGRHYAVSNTDGAGGYFESSAPWAEVAVPEGWLAYGTRGFPSRAALREYVAALPPAPPACPPPTPALLRALAPRLTLSAGSGRQLAHLILDGVLVSDIEYL